nr:hypothetical protein CFP56_60678 [Quercus suber]
MDSELPIPHVCLRANERDSLSRSDSMSDVKACPSPIPKTDATRASAAYYHREGHPPQNIKPVIHYKLLQAEVIRLPTSPPCQTWHG